MKNLNKILFIIGILILIVGSCKKTETIPAPKYNLGNISIFMKFNSQAVQIGDNLVFDISVTPGSKYSIQIADITGDVELVKGLNATKSTERVILDISKIDAGAYDLIFIDTKGSEIKQPLIIK